MRYRMPLTHQQLLVNAAHDRQHNTILPEPDAYANPYHDTPTPRSARPASIDDDDTDFDSGADPTTIGQCIHCALRQRHLSGASRRLRQ